MQQTQNLADLQNKGESRKNLQVYSQSESDNKYVVKTITVNGKPLSANVNLSAVDVGALPLTGGELSGTLGVNNNVYVKNGNFIAAGSKYYFASPDGKKLYAYISSNSFGDIVFRSVSGSFGLFMGGINGEVNIDGEKGYFAERGVRVYSPNNTTTDVNGFIKRASPIARLTNAPEKMANDFLDGFTLAGNVAVNNEAKGVSAKRISIGVYKIMGSLGFAKEGWTIELPQDVNGNRLCFVSTLIGKDGTITVKVSKRQFDVETAAIVAGEPMDIPEGRWIDLRLEMPVRKNVEEHIID